MSQEKKMDKSQIERLRKNLIKIEHQLTQMKSILSMDNKSEIPKIDTKNASGFIEGIFDGEEMLDKAGKKYTVSANYASKSKLIEGDKLKLVIAPDGTFVYKQIAPLDRKKLIGVLKEDSGKYKVKVDNKYYNVLFASVTYFQAKPGDKLTIIVPKDKDSIWAAVENKIE